MSNIVLKIENIRIFFKIKQNKYFFNCGYKTLKAIDDLSFEIRQGETLGIVGESGCGKSTLARAIVNLLPLTSGKIFFQGKDLTSMNTKERWWLKKDIQMIFQDSIASLDPRMIVGDIIAEPLFSFFPRMNKAQRQQKILEMMSRVGLPSNVINRYPHEFSGGQCQRIGIARALITQPKLLICDEPVSALDVSVQAQVINLLMKLQRDMDLTLIFISHDLSVIKHISHQVLVIYLGHCMEMADKKECFEYPLHPYSKALISAVPVADPRVERSRRIELLEGDLPSPINPPSGCVFRTRCPKATKKCSFKKPKETIVNERHRLSCFHF